jgi:precorrin-3B C17-methyltransferase
MSGKIWVVGFGPGSFEHITERARRAIDESDVIIGYKTYIDLILGLLNGQEIVRTGMTEEVSRAQKAVALAREGKRVAVISSGDAGIYGMAGLVYEVLVEQGWQEGDNPEVEVVPGISAINSCAALLGAPVMHDACLISLSDHLTPWDVIARRLRAAAEADFVVALYNPRSGRRTRQIVEAQRIFLEYRAPSTPVGLVKSAYRERQQIVRTTLGDMLNHEIGMLTTVIIGNSSTFYHGSLMITPRGYQRKYSLDKLEQRLRPGERLRPENEPWALGAGPSLAAIAEEALDRVTQAQAASTGGLTWTAALAEPKGVRNLAQPAETAATPGAATATPAALPASSGAPGAASEPASGPAANLSQPVQPRVGHV